LELLWWDDRSLDDFLPDDDDDDECFDVDFFKSSRIVGGGGGATFNSSVRLDVDVGLSGFLGLGGVTDFKRFISGDDSRAEASGVLDLVLSTGGSGFAGSLLRISAISFGSLSLTLGSLTIFEFTRIFGFNS
jgi:hypothetical protein